MTAMPPHLTAQQTLDQIAPLLASLPTTPPPSPDDAPVDDIAMDARTARALGDDDLAEALESYVEAVSRITGQEWVLDQSMTVTHDGTTVSIPMRRLSKRRFDDPSPPHASPDEVD